MKILKLESNSDRQEFVKRAYNNSTYKKMKAICEKYGYTIGLAYWANYDDAFINIRPHGDNEYAPEVYPPQVWIGKKEPWKIMTTSYGSLSIDDFEKFNEANNRAYNMIKELSNIDLTTLEHEPKED